ncbi:MAG: phosphoribosylamine--glycine ligase [Solirubrobacterales bacterium]|nr:phosphoribosylamine--glycine ligase [Solirubrobacterales bacterium]MCB0862295.1 phosphoribosylamine--glycine ligase [Solirubrobacterales bacterium]MCB8915835.1 phosphoribosylamine--glycine ligase [Thermoleophilales bacterium]
MSVRILVLGGGGREHAIVKALARSPRSPELFCAPGNPGIASDARCLPDLDPVDPDAVTATAKELEIDLVVVGPEAPLVAGVVDRLTGAGIAAFGPSGAAAQLEGSKAYAKQAMEEAGIPTAGYRVVTDRDAALAKVTETGCPVVLKADGLAAGKGVLICLDEAEAREAIEVFFTEQRFGQTEVVVEEFLEGEELSLLAICDGERAIPLAPAQDYKRIGEGDTGPNTGGMGSYSPVQTVGPDQLADLSALVHQPIVDLMARRGHPFHGVLYAGLMMTANGPKVLEYNTRFGDPETQAVLPRLESDLVDLFLAASTAGGLAGKSVEFADRFSVTVVLASAGYPASSSKGDVITGLEKAAESAEVVHAGTAEVNGQIVTAGGRVLNLTGLGPDAATARDRAYDAADAVKFDGKQMRRDIAERAVLRERDQKAT